MSFSFSFAGDDIEDDESHQQNASQPNAAPTATAGAAASSAFPVQGKPLLPPIHHDLDRLLANLPSKIAYSLLEVEIEGKGSIQIPRRELWDVRVQLMAEAEGEDDGGEVESGLGSHDVKTGIYEGGFKSWESSVDLVKVLAAENLPASLAEASFRIIELGCGTALPSLALFQWAMQSRAVPQQDEAEGQTSLRLILADYNPTVLQLVTMPNFLLAWALDQQAHDPVLQTALCSVEGELEITEPVLLAFKDYLASSRVVLSFVSGGWCPDFVNLIYDTPSSLPNSGTADRTLVLGAETIYSPFALSSFTDTLLSIMRRERDDQSSRSAVAIVAAKRLYFGVGGSLDDFVDKVRELGVAVSTMREEAEGVRRGVVKCELP